MEPSIWGLQVAISRLGLFGLEGSSRRVATFSMGISSTLTFKIVTLNI